MGAWVPPTVRYDVVEFVQHYSGLTGLSNASLIDRVEIRRDKFYDWRNRQGRDNGHNASAPRDF